MPERVRMRRRMWTLGTLAIMGLLFVNAVQCYRAINELVINERRTNNTQSILRSIRNIYSSVQDAELGLRGYLISGEAEYLKPYFMSLDSIKKHFQELEGLKSELPQQIIRIQKLQDIIKTRLGSLTEDINQKSENSKSRWVVTHNMQESHSSMQNLSILISEMENAEYGLLNSQSIASKKSRTKVLYTFVIANSALLLLILVVSFLIRRNMNQQLKEAENLELKVAQRTFELQLYSNELKRSNRELQDFAFIASHDLQEPLRKIRAFGDPLNSRYSDILGPDGADYVNRMQNAAARMARLIDDLLQFSRVSTKGDPFAQVDLNLVIIEVLENMEVTIKESNADIKIDQLPIIDADASQMKQLFQNIISNAIKFSQEGTDPIIRIRLEEQMAEDSFNSQMYKICISDNGIGFEEKYLDRIFTLFQRLHGKNEYEGTGIGLSICRRIVERHHGELSAESVVGEGTTFIIKLPRSQANFMKS